MIATTIENKTDGELELNLAWTGEIYQQFAKDDERVDEPVDMKQSSGGVCGGQKARRKKRMQPQLHPFLYG